VDKTTVALERLHEDYRSEIKKNEEDDEIIRIHTEENNDGC
tara:strand:+ start:579 stop:701 length:123 start_codon:yes stop_codon:yes gene_type:complete